MLCGGFRRGLFGLNPPPAPPPGRLWEGSVCVRVGFGPLTSVRGCRAWLPGVVGVGVCAGTEWGDGGVGRPARSRSRLPLWGCDVRGVLPRSLWIEPAPGPSLRTRRGGVVGRCGALARLAGGGARLSMALCVGVFSRGEKGRVGRPLAPPPPEGSGCVLARGRWVLLPHGRGYCSIAVRCALGSASLAKWAETAAIDLIGCQSENWAPLAG